MLLDCWIEHISQTMDSKKRLKRAKPSDTSDVQKTPNKVSKSSEVIANDLSDICGSPDLHGSQECFSVGWDWSDQIQGNRKPSIRVIERPVERRNDNVKLLECSRPRRLIRKYDPDLFDASAFVEELKSLGADFKRVPESTSPVASPPHSSFRRRGDVLVTPTSLKGPAVGSSTSTSVESITSTASVTPPSKNEDSGESRTDSLNELLDDSLGADLLKFTQELEQGLKQNESRTPRPQERGLNPVSSAKRKSRLTLSRRINDEENVKSLVTNVNESRIAAGDCMSNKKQDKRNNNEFDDLDEAALLTLCKLEELEGNSNSCGKEVNTNPSDCTNPSKNEVTKNSGNLACSSEKATIDIQPSLDDDDDFVSPDLLDMIDLWEKREAQKRTEASAKTVQAKPTKASTFKENELARTSDVLDKCKKQHERFLVKKNGEEAGKITEQLPLRKTLSLAGGKLRCTPEEIEKKRQNAIRKRLQLKKY